VVNITSCISSSVIGHLDQFFSQNVLLRYEIVFLQIVLIIVSSINLNPHYNLLTFCHLWCTDPCLFPACVVMFMVIFVFVCWYVLMGFASVSAVVLPGCHGVMCSYYVFVRSCLLVRSWFLVYVRFVLLVCV